MQDKNISVEVKNPSWVLMLLQLTQKENQEAPKDDNFHS